MVNAMLEHPDIKGITFVGSTPTGRDVIYKRCGETGKRVIAQCGAKNFMIVMPDANVTATIQAAQTSFFGNTGQRCLAAANFVVVGEDDKFYNSFMENLVGRVSKIKIGYGLDESVQMGPIRDKSKKDRGVSYIEKGVKEGARLRLDESKPKIDGNLPDTAFIGPTIFEGVTPEMTIAREEIFGPVMSVIRAKDIDEAISMCNTGPFGNGHSIFTTSGKDARYFQYHFESGNVGINVGRGTGQGHNGGCTARFSHNRPQAGRTVEKVGSPGSIS